MPRKKKPPESVMVVHTPEGPIVEPIPANRPFQVIETADRIAERLGLSRSAFFARLKDGVLWIGSHWYAMGYRNGNLITFTSSVANPEIRSWLKEDRRTKISEAGTKRSATASRQKGRYIACNSYQPLD